MSSWFQHSPRQQVVDGVADEDAAHVQLEAVLQPLVVLVVELVGRGGGDEQQGAELNVALGLEVAPGQRLAVVLQSWGLTLFDIGNLMR